MDCDYDCKMTITILGSFVIGFLTYLFYYNTDNPIFLIISIIACCFGFLMSLG